MADCHAPSTRVLLQPLTTTNTVLWRPLRWHPLASVATEGENMKLAHSTSSTTASSTKVPTGITGLDEITDGGLPRGRTTLLVGGSGSGKTILALQFLVHGAKRCSEPGIFVAFEETPARIIANAETFGWDLPELQRSGLYFMDAQPPADLVQSGTFDLSGMLAALGAKVGAMKATRIVFDALDIVL